MATSISVGYVPWCDGSTYNGLILRTFDAAPMAYVAGSSSTTAVRGGAYPSGGTVPLQVNASSGMNVTVNPGYCVVPNSTSSVQGAYRFGLLTQGTLTVPTSDPTNPRIDIVVAQVTDNGDATSFGQVEIVSGTPAGSPVAPTAPANSIPLAQISVGAGVSSIVAGNITDQRVYTVPPGGVLPVSAAASAPGGQNGSYIHDLTTGRLAHNSATGVKQTHLLPFSPVVAVKTTNTSTSGAEVTVLSATVTTDGATDIEVFAIWTNIIDNTGISLSGHANVNLRIDGTQVFQWVTGPLATNPPAGSGCIHYQTSSLLSNTPTSGSHTIAIGLVGSGTGSDSLTMQGFSNAPVQMTIKPVCL